MKRKLFMDKGKTYKVLLGGGGTGGHVFPAIAIADALKEANPDTEFLFVGALGKLEMEKVPEAGYSIEGLPVAGFQRRLTVKNISFFYKLGVSMVRSRRIVRRFRPDLAIGVGGYASGPILKAAARKRIPVLIQEQNSYAGVTNRLLARSASVICVAYEKMEKYFPAAKIRLTGNPVRQHLARELSKAEACEEFGLKEDRPVCLVIGGSLGARTLNTSMKNALKRFADKDMQLLWQCGKVHHEALAREVDGWEEKGIHLLPFISRMDMAYRVADVIVSRAGAISISELCLVGKPVILVPSPNVAEDHQRKNAEALVSREAALMVSDAEATELLADEMISLVGDEKIQQKLRNNIKQMAIGDAAQRIATEAMKLMEEA